MIIKNETITKGFIAAGLMNLSVLVFSRFFTNPTIAEADPNVMSNFGLLMIVIWGLSYISVAKSFQNVKWLVAVFAAEKFIYGTTWTKWILENSVEAIAEKDAMAGSFLSIYGINDWLFGIFFLIVFVQLIRKK